MLSVVLFHLDVDLFPGGFLGVDIFFVISGYLISNVIFNEIAYRRFSIANFYERRIRRLFPALFLVLFVTAIIAYWLLMPFDLRNYFSQLTATTLFSANMLFWHQGGYFDVAAIEKPLLHMWSLAVEEQFYVLYPVILVALYKWAKRYIPAVVAILAVSSFAGAVWASYVWPTSAFYLAPFRAWELFAGCLLALYGHRQHEPSMPVRNGMALAGIGLVLYSVTGIDENTVFPGAGALMPVLGTVLLIYAGTGHNKTWVAHITTWRPAVILGLLSYSLYLWHWPIIVFLRYYLIRPFTPAEQLAVFLLSLLLAWVSWRYVERPFRGKSGLFTRKQVFTLAGIVMAVLIGFGTLGYLTNGMYKTLPAQAEKIIATLQTPRPLQRTVSDSPLILDQNDSVIDLGGTTESPIYLVWGDSHASALSPALTWQGVSGRMIVRYGCPPLLDVNIFRGRVTDGKCAAHNAKVMRYLEDNPGISAVFLVARWGVYSNTEVYNSGRSKPLPLSANGGAENKAVFAAALNETLNQLRQRKVRVMMASSIPDGLGRWQRSGNH